MNAGELVSDYLLDLIPEDKWSAVCTGLQGLAQKYGVEDLQAHNYPRSKERAICLFIRGALELLQEACPMGKPGVREAFQEVEGWLGDDGLDSNGIAVPPELRQEPIR